MSVPFLGSAVSAQVTKDEILEFCERANLHLSDELAESCRPVIAALDICAKIVMARKDYAPEFDASKYPRREMDIIIDPLLDGGGWATKVNVTSICPENELLKSRIIALKDNIALAGVGCTNGTDLVGWTPDFDATVVQRVLDSSGMILGKAACESACWSTVSDTSITGPVRNPYHEGFSCGGSSSGSARLVAGGVVDVALGGDQGGSIRIPASACGVVGLKPTWGFVPYTGILGVSAEIDHAGPIARTVLDCELLLESIAGPDGLDDRQPQVKWYRHVQYSTEVTQHLYSAQERPLAGFRVGVVEEGFQHVRQDPYVAKVVRNAIDKFRDLGADVQYHSIPEHKDTEVVWMCTLPAFAISQGLVMNSSSRKQVALSEPAALGGGRLSQDAFDVLGPAGQNLYLRGLYLQERYGPSLTARCTNLLRQLIDQYDAVLDQVDVLVMPTTPFPPCRIFDSRDQGSVSARLKRTSGITANTAPFNASGHPALSIPVGFSPAAEDPEVMLPVGLQIVGRKFEGVVVLKVAASWEQKFNWKTLTAH